MRFLLRIFQIASAFLMCKVVPEHQINGDFSYFLFARNESVSNTAFSMGEFAKVGFNLILSRRRQLEASRRHGPTPLFDANALISFASQSSNFSMRIASDSPAADVILMRIRRRCETGKPSDADVSKFQVNWKHPSLTSASVKNSNVTSLLASPGL